MCVIVYKPKEEKMPKREILLNCFENNNDGAGFMLQHNDKVIIEKGFDTFESFENALEKAVKKYGANNPYVLHFRISTQAGTRKDCCHPYPLSNKMDDMRKLKVKTNIGIAHNGIISLTSNGYQKTITYNDTMLFITDYLSLIIKNKNYYKNADTLLLIERLCESRLAILDNDGHCELIGSGWIYEKADGCWYSNTSYKSYKHFILNNDFDYDSYYNQYEDFELKYNEESDMYMFEEDDICPLDDGDDFYCDDCINRNHCKKLQAYIDWLTMANSDKE